MTKNEFRQSLKRNGLSCDEFAALSGCSIRTIYEFGGRSPVPRYARRIIMDLDYFRVKAGVIGLEAINEALHNAGITK